MKVLAVDAGGTHVKVLIPDAQEPRAFESGSALTPQRMTNELKRLTTDWNCDAVAMGYPGLVINGRIASERRNLGKDWQQNKRVTGETTCKSV